MKKYKIFKDKEGNKLTFKEFLNRWKSGIETINPLQKIKVQIGGTKIMLIGLFLGLCVSIYGWKNLWWVGIILIGALLNTGVQYLGLVQQRKLLDNLEKQFAESDLPEEPQDNSPIETEGEQVQINSPSGDDDKQKPKVVILDNNELSVAKYAKEHPENFKEISNSIDKENHSQRKKDEDSSRGNHLETQSDAGEDNLARDMPVVVDNHADVSNKKPKVVQVWQFKDKEKEKEVKTNEEKLLREDRSNKSSKVLDRSNNDRSRNFVPLFNLLSFT